MNKDNDPEKFSTRFPQILSAWVPVFLYKWLFFAVLIYFGVLVLFPIMSFLKYGVFMLPSWGTPLKLLFAPIVCAGVYTTVIAIAVLMGFDPLKAK
jgi:hypothetical protein